MPIPVTVYTYAYADHEIPLHERTWTMYALPSPGDRYWHVTEALRVRDVDQTTEPPQLHMVHDHKWADEVRAALPEGYSIDGGRDPGDGRWHFMAITPPHGRPLGPVFADELEPALAEAIGNAVRHHQASAPG